MKIEIGQTLPELVKEIANAGHEVATHGYSHLSITKMNPDEFEEDLKQAIDITSSIINKKIIGYRAPHFTVTSDTLWSLDILARYGIKYDSSIFPFGFHPDYGISDARIDIHKISADISEVPLSVVSLLGVRVPCGGGAYFRFLPYSFSRKLLRKCNENGRPIVFYLHPWELDPNQPRLKLSYLNRMRHYTKLDRTQAKLIRLLKDFKFDTIRGVLGL